MPANEEQSREGRRTRDALVRVAHDLFVNQGYAATRTEDIVRRAAVTRGALYHHFADKRALFQAVFEDVQRDFVDRYFKDTAEVDDPWDRLRQGVQLFLDAALQPAVRRIILVDGPAVLGWDTWRELAGRYTGVLFEAAIDRAVAEGTITAVPSAPLAHVLMGGFQAAGFLVAQAPSPEQMHSEVAMVVDWLINGLRAAPPGEGRPAVHRGRTGSAASRR